MDSGDHTGRDLRRAVTAALVSSGTISDRLQRCAEGLTESGRYSFAWIDRYDADRDALTPVATAGADRDGLGGVSLETDAVDGPVVEVVRRREIRVEPDLLDDPPGAEWRAHARAHGYRSIASVPLVSGDALAGVLHLGAERPDAFDPEERDRLAEVADTVALAVRDADVAARSGRADGASEAPGGTLGREDRDAGLTDDAYAQVGGAQYLRALLQTTPECIKVVGEDGTLRDMNPAGLEMVQAAEASSVIGSNVYDLVAPDDRQRFREFNERICRGERGTLEFDIVGLDGDRRHMETHAAPMETPDGSTAQVALTRDVTDLVDRRRELEQYRATARAASDAIVVIDDDSIVRSANPAVADVFGYAPEELEGEPLTKIMSEELGSRHLEGIQRYLNTGERTLDWDRVELPGRHADGHEVPLSISFSEYEFDGERYFAGIARDVTERERYERALRGLHEASRDLVQAETAPEVAERTVEAATNVLDLDGVGVYLFDEAANELRPAATTAYVEELFGELPAFGPGDTAITWETFLSGETVVHDDVRESVDAHRTDTPLRSGVWIPLGDHGVLAIVSETVGGLDERARSLADHLAATAEATLDRVEREETLRDHEHELAAQNRRLQELDRMNAVIREIDQELIEATTTEDVEEAVCELLTSDDRFAFAWIGGVVDDAVTPRTWAGDGRGYLDEASLAIPASDADSEGAIDGDVDPSVRAASTGEVAVVGNVSEDLGSAPWRKAALSSNLQSGIAVPLRYGEVGYGVLTVYASRPDAFDDLSRAVLEELGETIANAMNAVETERALLTDSVVELDVAIDEADDPLARLAEAIGCEIEFQGIVPGSGGESKIFFTAAGVDAEVVRTATAESPRFEQVTILDEGPEECHVETTVEGSTVPSTLVECGAAVSAVRFGTDGTRALLELPRAIDVRTFVERLEATYPDAELVARRDERREDPSSGGFEAELVAALTDRQLEVLQTAYLSGYFEWPRERTGEEVATSLDITQSTFNGHLREAERKLCSLLFDGTMPSA